MNIPFSVQPTRNTIRYYRAMVELLEAVQKEEKGKNDWKGREFAGRYKFGHRTCRDYQSVPASYAKI